MVRPSLEGTAVICYGPRGQRGIRDALLCVCFSVTTPLAHSARARLKGDSKFARSGCVREKTRTSTESQVDTLGPIPRGLGWGRPGLIVRA